jgi:hypothetical protein
MLGKVSAARQHKSCASAGFGLPFLLQMICSSGAEMYILLVPVFDDSHRSMVFYN